MREWIFEKAKKGWSAFMMVGVVMTVKVKNIQLSQKSSVFMVEHSVLELLMYYRNRLSDQMVDEWVGRSLFEGLLCERVWQEIDVGETPFRHSDLGPVYLFYASYQCVL